MADSDELAKLADLHQRGVLTDEEFSRAKARVLSAAAGAHDAAPAGGPLSAFHRSRGDRWLGGVCGGVAQVTGVPSWFWRLLFTLLALCAGSGVLLYLLLWIFVPEESMPIRAGQQSSQMG